MWLAMEHRRRIDFFCLSLSLKQGFAQLPMFQSATFRQFAWYCKIEEIAEFVCYVKAVSLLHYLINP